MAFYWTRRFIGIGVINGRLNNTYVGVLVSLVDWFIGKAPGSNSSLSLNGAKFHSTFHLLNHCVGETVFQRCCIGKDPC